MWLSFFCIFLVVMVVITYSDLYNGCGLQFLEDRHDIYHIIGASTINQPTFAQWSSWKKCSNKELIFLLTIKNLSLFLLFLIIVLVNERFMPKLIKFTTTSSTPSSPFIWWMTFLVTMLIRKIKFLWVFTFSFGSTCWNAFTILIFLLLFVLPPYWGLENNAPSVFPSSLMTLHYSWSWKAFSNSAKVISDKSLVFSKVIMVASNHSSTFARIFSIIRKSLNME